MILKFQNNEYKLFKDTYKYLIPRVSEEYIKLLILKKLSKMLQHHTILFFKVIKNWQPIYF